MRYPRLAFWLLLLPGALIYFAWSLSQYAAEIRRANDDSAPQPSAEELQAAAEEEAARLARLAEIEGTLVERRRLAERCVTQGLRSMEASLDDNASLLVLLSANGCGEGCDSEALATELASSYYLEGLRVMLIRTVERREGSQPPAGVYAIVMPSCAPLVRDHGDDYFFRNSKGLISNSGERHERILRATEDIEVPFNPEPLVRSSLNLPPR